MYLPTDIAGLFDHKHTSQRSVETINNRDKADPIFIPLYKINSAGSQKKVNKSDVKFHTGTHTCA